MFDADDFSQSSAQSLNVDSNSNKLLGFSQTLTKVRGTKTLAITNSSVNYTLDANGAMTSDGLRAFNYDEASRLASVNISKDGQAASVQYLSNGMGQRVFKSEITASQSATQSTTQTTTSTTTPTTATTALSASFITYLQKTFGWLYASAQSNTSVGTAYTYADGPSSGLPNWVMLGEYDNGSASGKGRSEYIWLPLDDGNAIPVGMYRNGKFFAIHADHLGTPRLMTNDQNTPVWQWPYSAFGNNKPTGVLKATSNPKAAVTINPVLLRATAATELNLRMPGQYFDEEAGLFYNWNRMYQANSGSYTQMDPIGLQGGLNRRGYVGGNSLIFTDQEGLMGNGPSGGNRYTPVNKGNSRPGFDYCSASFSGPIIGYGVTITRYGDVFLTGSTGGLTPTPSVQAAAGRINGPIDRDSLNNFLGGASGNVSYGQYGIGFSNTFSGGRVSNELTIGTPALPRGGMSYSKQVN